MRGSTGQDVQLEEPEHPHSPFMMTDLCCFGGLGGCEIASNMILTLDIGFEFDVDES